MPLSAEAGDSMEMGPEAAARALAFEESSRAAVSSFPPGCRISKREPTEVFVVCCRPSVSFEFWLAVLSIVDVLPASSVFLIAKLRLENKPPTRLPATLGVERFSDPLSSRSLIL